MPEEGVGDGVKSHVVNLESHVAPLNAFDKANFGRDLIEQQTQLYN